MSRYFVFRWFRFPIVENNTLLSQEGSVPRMHELFEGDLSPLEVFFEFVSVLNQFRSILRKIVFYKSFKVSQRLTLPRDVFVSEISPVEQ
jgi:hypothetical protein